MTEWEPATEAEAAMRDALRAQDQERYFRILARTDLLLPVAQASAQAPGGWGTWTSGGRTHVLAFTSATALRTCLGEHAGSNRRVPYADLAAGWPNPEWWLAVNPGLPVEGYLPAWFVAQLSRGDVRLPGRTLGARARLERAESLARARASGSGREAPPAAGRPETGPLSGLPGRAAFGGGGPAAGAPLGTDANGPATRGPAPTTPAALPRRPGESAPSGWPSSIADAAPPATGREATDRRTGAEQGRDAIDRRAGTEQVRGAARSAPPAFTGRPPSARRGPVEETGRASTGNGRTMAGREAGSTGEGGESARRSFFEPASGRGSTSARGPLRPGDRATPPSRFGLGGQPFPRRGQDNEPTQAFLAPDREPTPAPRPPADPAWPGPTAAPGVDATQPLPSRRPGPHADEPTRAFGVTGPLFTSPGRPSPGPDDEVTQPLRHGYRTHPEDLVEELPPSVAEPVSGPPEPRRGFTPIVIEGTIVESRDLLDPPDDEPVPDRFGAGAFGTRPAGSWDDSAPADAGSRWDQPPTGGAAGAGAGTGPAGGDLWGGSRPSGPHDAGSAFFTGGAGSAPGTGTAPGGVGPDARTDAHLTGGLGGDAGSGGIFTEGGGPDAANGANVTGGAGAHAASGAGTETGGSAGTGRDGSAGPDFWNPRSSRSPAAPTDDPVEAPGPFAGTVGRDATGGAPAAGASATGSADALAGGNADALASGNADAADAAVKFQPANAVEEDLLGAVGAASTDSFLSTLLLARVLLPVAAESSPGSRPGDPGFVWRTEEVDGETFVVVYTSPERLADHVDGEVETVRVKFVQLIRRWPDSSWSFSVNPGTPVGAKLPGEQIVGLANWAADVGLGDDETDEASAAAEPAERTRPAAKPVDPTRPVVMQKAVAPSQLAYYLERGYDRVSGFVHRANELAHLNTPAQLYDALGLNHPDSPFSRDADEIYVLRWPAYRPSLYRIPYGGQNEAAMRAMEGWVIERPPFRGNGFAPGESSDVVAEFKVDSARLPHGAQLWRIGADGTERVIAILDTDAPRWREVETP
ncbi:SseB family protein [Micromonospora costi]|uniref:SseB family protein n=1 Tax=Micromonospora costi TaxID=1530042 RepID=UPI001F4E617E|nr:SseB family protein [Micromonospora costi]